MFNNELPYQKILVSVFHAVEIVFDDDHQLVVELLPSEFPFFHF